MLELWFKETDQNLVHLDKLLLCFLIFTQYIRPAAEHHCMRVTQSSKLTAKSVYTRKSKTHCVSQHCIYKFRFVSYHQRRLRGSSSVPLQGCCRNDSALTGFQFKAALRSTHNDSSRTYGLQMSCCCLMQCYHVDRWVSVRCSDLKKQPYSAKFLKSI